MGELLRQGRAALAERSESPALDAELLLAAALGWARSRLFAWPEWVPTAVEAERYQRHVEQRAGGRPVAYLLGRREFWGLNLQVDESTLVPRPETELLVQLALDRIEPGRSTHVADLGTGSGAVALALGRERPDCRIFAVELSAPALETARVNAQRLGVDNVTFHRGDWFAGLPPHRPLDMIVSNPPYVASDDPALNELRHEPQLALVAGDDGFAAIRRIAAGAPSRLRPGGWILLEHGSGQGHRVSKLLEHAGWEEVQTEADLGGLERVTLARKPLRAELPEWA